MSLLIHDPRKKHNVVEWLKAVVGAEPGIRGYYTYPQANIFCIMPEFSEKITVMPGMQSCIDMHLKCLTRVWEQCKGKGKGIKSAQRYLIGLSAEKWKYIYLHLDNINTQFIRLSSVQICVEINIIRTVNYYICLLYIHKISYLHIVYWISYGVCTLKHLVSDESFKIFKPS